MYEQRKWRGVTKRGEKQTSQLKALPPAAVWQSVKVCIERRRTFMSRTNRNATFVCVCALNVKPKCWDAGGQLEVLFRFFSLEKNDSSPLVCHLLWWSSSFHSLSSVSALWVKSSNISDYFATVLQALPVQPSCWEVGYHHLVFFWFFCCFIRHPHMTSHMFSCVCLNVRTC